MVLDGIDFYIGMNEMPASWHCKNEEDQKKLDKLYHTFNVVKKFKHAYDEYTKLPDGTHPVLRFEDIVAHLFLQVQLNPELLEEKARAARQYANQICRKICWNCSHYDMDEILSNDLAQRLEERNVTHLNCYDCRASRTIVSANNFKKYMSQPDAFHQLWQDALANYYALRRTLKHARMVTQKVIAAKVKVEKELRDYKVRGPFMQHKIDLSKYSEKIPTIMPTEFDSPPTAYTEKELQEQIDDAPDVPTPDEVVKKADNLSEILYTRPDYNREDLSTPDDAVSPKPELTMKYTGVEPPVKPWNREEQAKLLDEKERFDEAMKESMAENKDTMIGLADYDEQPIVGRTIEKVVIDEVREFDKEPQTEILCPYCDSIAVKADDGVIDCPNCTGPREKE